MSSPQPSRPKPTQTDTLGQLERRNRLEDKARELFRVFDQHAGSSRYGVSWEQLNPGEMAAFRALVQYFEDQEPLCDCGRVLRCVRCDVEAMR